eukprot:s1066_g3.t1
MYDSVEDEDDDGYDDEDIGDDADVEDEKVQEDYVADDEVEGHDVEEGEDEDDNAENEVENDDGVLAKFCTMCLSEVFWQDLFLRSPWHPSGVALLARSIRETSWQDLFTMSL